MAGLANLNETQRERVLDRMLHVLEHELVPRTAPSVEQGNKVFGAAILAKRDLELVVVAVNRETHNPLWHGEIACLNDYWALPPENRPAPAECWFLSTHEPCSMCLSAITWSGFDNFFYFFSYEDSRDLFEIPHDLRMLEEVFGCEAGRYRPANAYWQAESLVALIESGDAAARAERLCRADRLRARYAEMSLRYQDRKGDDGIPLA